MKQKPEFMESRFRVESFGFGHTFPLDMLRYDSATFATEKDAMAAERYMESGNTAKIEIELRRFYRAGNPPVPGHKRWESFGWRIVGGR